MQPDGTGGQSLRPELRTYEDLLRTQGYGLIAGVDEVGRGPLAGPVVAAAVVLPLHPQLDGLDDSKRLSAAHRERIYEAIVTQALGIGCGAVSPVEVDEFNVLQASLHAMCQAVGRLPVQPEYVLVDGSMRVPGLYLPQEPVVGGDGLHLSVAAASVVAKVVRDRIMTFLDQVFPGYDFAVHKGYATPAHLRALQLLGPSPVHRRSFRPVMEAAAARED